MISDKVRDATGKDPAGIEDGYKMHVKRLSDPYRRDFRVGWRRLAVNLNKYLDELIELNGVAEFDQAACRQWAAEASIRIVTELRQGW